ncbi:MAG: LamG-like jellyroll fold domain-containing protein [Phycisphaerae bacterium]
MINKKHKMLTARRGAALIIVLGVVMVVTVVALAYLSRSDGELQYGQNMLLRTQVDYLAESALEHARGLLLNPQEISGEYWPGAASQQLEAPSDYYYDVAVEPNGIYGYKINCEAYRYNGSERTAQSSLEAMLELNPCVAYLSNSTSARQLSSRFNIVGDAAGNLLNYGTVTGQIYSTSELSLDWPDVNIADFTGEYTFETISSSLSGENKTFVKCDGDLEIAGNVQIEGMLIVDGDLRITGTNNLIQAARNIPAMLVTGDVTVEQDAAIDIEGLAVIEGQMYVSVGCEDVNVLGGLLVSDGIVETAKAVDGHQAVMHGEPLCVTDGARTAISFDGSDDFMQTYNSSDWLQITNDYTLAVWIKADATQKFYAGIFSKTDPAGNDNHWTLQFDSSSPRRLIVHHSSSNSWYTGIKIDDIKNGWHHIAITRSGNTMKTYLDGDEKKSETWFSSPSSGYGHFNIACDRTGSNSYTYKGLIDDMRIFNQPLDVDDVNDIMNGVEISSGLLANFKLNEDGLRNIEITAAPVKTAIWCCRDEDGNWQRWSQAADAIYKVIRRN